MTRLLLLLTALLAGPATAQLAGHGGPVRALVALPDGGLASAGFDGAIILWRGGAARAVLRWHGAPIAALARLPDGRLASAGEAGRIALWSPDGTDAPSAVLEAGEAPIAALAAAADGRLAAAGFDGAVRVWDAAGGATERGRHAGPATALAWTGDGLVSAGYDGTLRVWDSAGERTLAAFGLPQHALLALVDGTLVAGGADGIVRLLDPAGGVRRLEAGPRPVLALAAAGDTLAVATLGGAVTLWSLPEGRLRATLDGPGLPVWSLAFADAGATLWTGGADRVIRRWDAARGRPLDLPAPPALEATAPPAFRACAACHALTADGPPLAGPHLARIFGRRMGSLPGYRYSERLAQGDVLWTPATVAELFTRGPDEMLPGTRMPVQRVADPEELAALLAYLEQRTR